MYDNTNVPLGSDTPNAPWNEKLLHSTVTVCICLSKEYDVEYSEGEIPEEVFKNSVEYQHLTKLFSKFNIDDICVVS